jgi:Fur family peroxide stress response transcriptional regulator
MTERLHSHLSLHHRSITPARDAVYLALHRLGPCTKPELVAALADQVDPATVYRSLDLFIQLRIAHIVRYRLVELADPFHQHHHHFVCHHCGREINFSDDRLETAIAAYGKQLGWQVEAHQIELSGLCPDCARAQS